MGIYPTGVSDDIIALCNQDATIANTLAKAPTTPCHTVHEQLYRKPFVLKRLVNRFMIKHDLYYGRGDPTQEDLDRAEKCGTFPYRPSNLFLKVSAAALEAIYGPASLPRIEWGEASGPFARIRRLPAIRGIIADANEDLHWPCGHRSFRTSCYVLKETRWRACARPR